MRVVEDRSGLRAAVRGWRAEHRSVALVPTMGALHDGHLSLVDAARSLGGAVVASVFVNPLQFGPHEDLARYPRDLAGDRRRLESRGVDLLFAPPVDEMFPRAPAVTVDPGPLGRRLEGEIRPGHFAGVLTVVAKLFHLAEPDVAFFGQKDIQQVTLIRQMVRDLNWPLSIAVVPTVREPDGLALSSRNAFLSPAERNRASVLFRALSAVQAAWRNGVADVPTLDQVAHGVFASESTVTVDYIAIVDPDRLEPVVAAAPGSVVAVAARLGSTRLIDNLTLGTGG